MIAESRIKYYEKFDRDPEVKSPSYLYFLILPNAETKRHLQDKNKKSKLFYSKIGTSVNPINRISDLNTALPFASKTIVAELPFLWKGFTAQEFEKSLHKFLGKRNRSCVENCSSKEWFLLTESEIEELVSLTNYYAEMTLNCISMPFSQSSYKEYDARYFDKIKNGYLPEINKSFWKKLTSKNRRVIW